MNRVFVTGKAAGGVEETGLLRAAVGAEETEALQSSPWRDGSAGDALATLSTAASPDEAQADAEKFLRIEVVCWMSSLEADGPPCRKLLRLRWRG